MRIPSKVNILGQDFKVVPLKKKKDTDHIGICYAWRNRIELDGDLVPDTAGETFLHEVIHAIEQKLVLKLTEAQVNNLALALYQFLKQNNIDFRKKD
jgi:hypothetical protein